MRIRQIALVPAYEPDEKMPDVVRELDEAGFEIVVVDDGSGENYKNLFARVEDKAIVLTHEVNKGKGAALKTGLAYIYKYMSYSESFKSGCESISSSGHDAVIVTVDADGQHKAQDALRIAEVASRRRDALVLGSRTFDGDVPARSMAGNTITRHVYSMATGVSIRDTQTGLRAFRMDMIPRLLKIPGERYEYEINMLLELASEGTTIIEEDIETVYIEDNKSSHFNTFKDSFRVYREILKFSASSLAGFGIDYLIFGALLAATGAWNISNGLVLSNIGARIVSATANYTINRKLVFRSKAGIGKSAAQYFLLAGIILAGNTAVLSALTGILGLGSMIAKIITEIIFFFVSWTVQKYVIFYKGDRDDEQVGKRLYNIHDLP